MAKIIQLSEHVANMIAAGEVVESPLSVVKELVENSIDAQATNIQIHLIESGIKKVEIVDNGIGMDEDDALMAFSRHATSKIKTTYDLASIDTLGFRGEALPSIASVSLVELFTKPKDKEGIKVTYKAGKFISKEKVAMNDGTRIIVSNLFYNTPARLKYLKSPNIILASICELVDKLALANRKIRFTLTNNNQTLLQTRGKDDIVETFAMIYGTNVAKNLKFNSNYFDGITVNATFTTPLITRSRKNDITTVVNGRYVKSNLVNNAVIEAYKDYIPQLRYPICLVDIEIDPLLIDVNVHPQKMDIKFSTEQNVSNLVKDVIQEGLKELQIIQTFNTTIKKENTEPINFDEYVSNSNEYDDTSKVINEETIFEEKLEEEKQNTAILKEEYTPLKEEYKEITHKEKKAKLPYLEYIGQYTGTYLLFQNEDGLFLLDQHAAQERINYEYYYEVLKKPNKEFIQLLIPFNFEFKKEEALMIKEHQKQLQNIGLILEESGFNSFFVREIPTWIKANNPDVVLEKILYFLLEKNSFDIGMLRDSLAKQIACKASIKANQYISKDEVYKLLQDLNNCENPFNCPHGRPVFVKITNYDIEKLFKRVV